MILRSKQYFFIPKGDSLSMKPFIMIINGPACAGKTSVSEYIWQKIPRTALINLDEFKWLVSDHETTEFDLELASKVGISAMAVYLEHGINVIIEKAFCDYQYVRPFIDFGNSKGFKVFLFNLEAKLDILKERCCTRVVKRCKVPMTEQKVEEIFEYYQKGKFSVDKTFDSSATEVKEIGELIINKIRLE